MNVLKCGRIQANFLCVLLFFMGPLEQAKSELIRQFETLVTTDQQPAIARLQTKMKLGVDLLAWMKGQLVYPQFYLRFRDEAKTVAAVGK